MAVPLRLIPANSGWHCQVEKPTLCQHGAATEKKISRKVRTSLMNPRTIAWHCRWKSSSRIHTHLRKHDSLCLRNAFAKNGVAQANIFLWSNPNGYWVAYRTTEGLSFWYTKRWLKSHSSTATPAYIQDLPLKMRGQPVNPSQQETPQIWSTCFSQWKRLKMVPLHPNIIWLRSDTTGTCRNSSFTRGNWSDCACSSTSTKTYLKWPADQYC